MPKPTPDIRAAIKSVNRVHDHCLLMRNLLNDRIDGIDGEMLSGLAHVFETIMTDMECALSDLDPA